jgi:hypothetical protein
VVVSCRFYPFVLSGCQGYANRSTEERIPVLDASADEFERWQCNSLITILFSTDEEALPSDDAIDQLGFVSLPPTGSRWRQWINGSSPLCP